MQGIVVDVEMRQIRREGFDAVALTPMQTALMTLYARHAPRPIHDDRILVYYWTEKEEPRRNLWVFVCQVNKRLAPIHLMLRRSFEFGYYLVDCPQPVMAAAKDAVMEAIRG